MDNDTPAITIFDRRYQQLLRQIYELPIDSLRDQGLESILELCCSILLQDEEYSFVWAGCRDKSRDLIAPLAAFSTTSNNLETCLHLVQESFGTGQENNPALKSLQTATPVILRDLSQGKHPEAIRYFSHQCNSGSCGFWPLIYQNHEYGFLALHSIRVDGFTDREILFLDNIVSAICRTLYIFETSERLKQERDFNREIVDTVEALMVTISPCGEILSFNSTAQQVTGYTEEQVYKKYWVDVLITPEKRAASQQMLSSILKKGKPELNFQAILQTQSGGKRTINWHGSIRRDIEQGQVGLVLFGLDITDQVEANKAFAHVRSKWENIFSAMQDPALIVTKDGKILDVNSATLTAARKTSDQVIGANLCDIIHGGSSPHPNGQVKTILQSGQSRVLEAELKGLHGNYMLTISPLKQETGRIWAALILARDLTEEKLMKAEAMRASQLAVVGELAAGVAHEINNPINGIINYAQILKDSSHSKAELKFLDRIIKEGKRIAGFTKNLLDFSRKQEEVLEPVKVENLIQHCIELVQHQYTKDGITLDIHYADFLPEIYCNPQHIQQVLLNILSNSRYALNQRYQNPSEKKCIQIKVNEQLHGHKYYVRISITDFGTGIKAEIMDRLMDPFFSTKPSGEGTGLGLSISQSLIKDNNGYFRIHSTWGECTTIAIDLPMA